MISKELMDKILSQGFTKEQLKFVTEEIYNLQYQIDLKEYTILGIMHSVDKWLEGDELKLDEVSRGIIMREKTLKLVEETIPREKLQEFLDKFRPRLNFSSSEYFRIMDEIYLEITGCPPKPYETIAYPGTKVDEPPGTVSVTTRPVCDNCGLVFEDAIKITKYQRLKDPAIQKSMVYYPNYIFDPYTCPRCGKVINEVRWSSPNIEEEGISD